MSLCIRKTLNDMKKAEDWLQLLSDESRADVMKVQIAETELTKRKVTEEFEKTKRDRANSDNYQTVKGLAVGALVIVAMCATCVGHRAVEANQAIKMNDKNVVQGVIPPPKPTN